MSRWFRFYDDAINDPKILRLPPDAFRSWVFLLCVASKSGGKLPSNEDIALYLRTKPQRAAAILAQLVAAGLIDRTDDGFEPHNWSGRQYLSDSSKDRVQRHRDKRAAAGLTPQWTAPAALRQSVYKADNHECVYCGSNEFLSIDHKTSELNGGSHDFGNLVTACRSCNGAKRDLSFDEYVTKAKIETLHGRFLKRPQNTEADNRTEHKKETREVALVDDGWPDDYRERFWAKYPNKVGKPRAIAKLEGARKRGVPWQSIIVGLDRYILTKPIDRPWLNPETFINQQRWDDQPAVVLSTGPPRGGPQGFESLFQQTDSHHEQSTAGQDFDLDLRANYSS